MNKEINGEMINIPEHVAIIMDGNGRWAKKRLMPRTYGHSEGAKAIERTCENADELGIKYLTVYAFSTENWKTFSRGSIYDHEYFPQVSG